MSKYKAELTFGLGNSKINSMNLEQQRYGRNKNTVINHTYIESGAYRRKFDKITDNKEVNRVLFLKAKEMLNHRSGTLFEDMYWIDADSGEIVAKLLDEKEEQKINYTPAIKGLIKNRRLITMHTHPESFPPSDADFNSAFIHGYYKNLIICHDGKIFVYSSDDIIDRDLYSAYVEKFKKLGYNEYEAQIITLNNLAENHDIYFKEV